MGWLEDDINFLLEGVDAAKNGEPPVWKVWSFGGNSPRMFVEMIQFD